VFDEKKKKYQKPLEITKFEENMIIKSNKRFYQVDGKKRKIERKIKEL
jgi:hypothetical protein